MKYWTGIGSREVPAHITLMLQKVARYMSDNGHTLRSGGAAGSDTIFQKEVDPELTQIWIPWKGFNKVCKDGNHVVISDKSFNIARDFYLDTGIIPWFDRMKQGAQKLHARNYFQVVGKEGLGEPKSEVCIYYAEMNGDEPKGGTRSAVMVARHFGIPCYNLGISSDLDKLDKYLDGI